ncbi:MAG: type II toxin-antitoxin system HicA family toxin [Verrucomicrobiota bacterium]
MGKHGKTLKRILMGTSDANIKFDDLRALLKRLGFEERIRGSHHVYRREGIMDKPNLQKTGSHAKPYQVKQVRDIILRHHLAGELDG